MPNTWAVPYVKVEIFYKGDPPGQLAHVFWGFSQPLQCGMVSANYKTPAHQILFELFQTIHDSE